MFHLFSYLNIPNHDRVLSLNQTIQELNQTIHDRIDQQLNVTGSGQTPTECEICMPPKTFASVHEVLKK